MPTITLELPWPPSVNHYWRFARGHWYISDEGKRYRNAVTLACLERHIKPMAGKLALSIQLWPPDKRKRDIDNVLKALLDALTHGGAYNDDSQVKWLHVEMLEHVKGVTGADVEINEIE